MLKVYLLTNISIGEKRATASELWKSRTAELRDVAKEVEPDFFKAWLRSQYALSIRGKGKGAKPGDFEQIGSEFHRWVRQHAAEQGEDSLVLRQNTDDFYELVMNDLDFYSRHYLRLMKASSQVVEGL